MTNNDGTDKEATGEAPAATVTSVAGAVSTVQVAEDTVSANDDVYDTDLDENLEFLPENVESEDVAEAPEAEEKSVDMADVLDDKAKVNNGVLLTYRGKTKVKLARMNNTAYQTMLQKLYQAHKHTIDSKTPEGEKLAVRCTLQAAAKCVVKGWEGMTLGGEEVPYTPKAALYLLQNSDDFKQWVEREARRSEHYFKVSTEADKQHLKELLLGS